MLIFNVNMNVLLALKDTYSIVHICTETAAVTLNQIICYENDDFWFCAFFAFRRQNKFPAIMSEFARQSEWRLPFLFLAKVNWNSLQNVPR